MTRRKPKTPEDFDTAFLVAVTGSGGEVLTSTNPYEVMRFRTSYGVGVVYKNAKGVRTWNAEAKAARAHMDARRGTLAPVHVVGARAPAGTAARLLERDGDGCFFCGRPLAGSMTIEHLVARSHGGPNHISNLFLAHQSCNGIAGHLSAPEKIALRENWPQAAKAIP